VYKVNGPNVVHWACGNIQYNRATSLFTHVAAKSKFMYRLVAYIAVK